MQKAAGHGSPAYNAPMAASTRVPILAMILGAVGPAASSTLQAQIRVRDLQVLEGPWECRIPLGFLACCYNT
jgi:hypothetical protein